MTFMHIKYLANHLVISDLLTMNVLSKPKEYVRTYSVGKMELGH